MSTSSEIEFSVPNAGKPCKTWYQAFGDLTKSRPLVALHGGPGASHDYLITLSALSHDHGIPVVLYDQLGNGKSTHLPEKAGDVSFWTVDLFLRELDNVLSHLGIKDDYDLLGHSWGGMLAACHAVRQPSGLKRLIIASSPASMELWVTAQNELRSRLDEGTQNTLTKHEKEGTTQSKEYEDAVEVFYKRFLCSMDPWPESAVATMNSLKADPTVYLTMNGPNEFYITGSLKTWSVIDEIARINVPTLLTNGRSDGAQDSTMLPYFERISKVKWVTLEKSSHMPHLEEEKRFIEVVHRFLRF
ncbi:proline-specific peptidase [Marasmius fiardii PR-910]|nr:proline-specific peptidase [Marasmius fiardii PR-910]